MSPLPRRSSPWSALRPVPRVRASLRPHPVRTDLVLEHVVATALLAAIALVLPFFSVCWSLVFAVQLAWRHARRRFEPWGPSARHYLPASYAWATVGTLLPATLLLAGGIAGFDRLVLAASSVLLPFLVGAPLGWIACTLLVPEHTPDHAGHGSSR